MKVKAYAKINLGLAVTAKRADGYHNLDSLLTCVDLCDDVSVKLDKSGKVEVCFANCKQIENNSAKKAAEAFKKKFALDCGIKVKIVKNIPFGGGLGGSSADAAAVLRALCVLTDRAVDDDLLSVAAETGSDTVALVKGGYVRITDKGDTAVKLNVKRKLYFAVVCGGGADTATVFKTFDDLCGDGSTGKNCDGIVKTLTSGGDVSTETFNDLTEACFAAYPAQKILAQKCKVLTGKDFCMTGSGSCMFYCCDSRRAATDLQKVLKSGGVECFVCQSVDF